MGKEYKFVFFVTACSVEKLLSVIHLKSINIAINYARSGDFERLISQRLFMHSVRLDHRKIYNANEGKLICLAD